MQLAEFGQIRLPIAPSAIDAIAKQEYVIDIETCLDPGGKLDVIACTEGALIIGKILRYVQRSEKLTGSLAWISSSCSKVATVPPHLPIGNFCASAGVKYYSATNISMSSRRGNRRLHGSCGTRGERQ